MLSISKATATDIPVIRDLAMQVWPQTYTPILGEEQVAYMLGLFYAPDALRKQIEAPGHTFLICCDDGLPVAFAGYEAVDDNVVKLHKIYIAQSQQGKGIGKFLLAAIVDDIKKKGAIALRLNVNRYNYNAKAFYEKSGFVHVNDEDIDIGNGYYMNDHVLQLPLNPTP